MGAVHQSVCETEPVISVDDINIKYVRTYLTYQQLSLDLNNVKYFLHGPEYLDGVLHNGCDLTCEILNSQCSESLNIEGLVVNNAMMTVLTDLNLEGKYCIKCGPSSLYNTQAAYTTMTVEVD